MKNIVFAFIRCPEARLNEVDNGLAPRESLLGYHHLKATGANVRHFHHSGGVGQNSLADKLRENAKTLLWAHSILFATHLRFITPLICRLMGKQVVFYDAFQRLPRHPLKKLYTRLCIAIAHRCIFYSKNQLSIWQAHYPGLVSKGRAITYGIDSEFFTTPPEVQAKDVADRHMYVSIGRDPSRDFSVLADAFDNSDRKLILVTQDYMLSDKLKRCENVTIQSGLSYTELSDLYDQAKASVIPIEAETSHLSGIRAAMEAMAKYVPVVITHNESLAEYFNAEEHVLYFEAGNVEALQATLAGLEQSASSAGMTLAAYALVSSQYNYPRMCNELLEAIDA